MISRVFMQYAQFCSSLKVLLMKQKQAIIRAASQEFRILNSTSVTPEHQILVQSTTRATPRRGLR